MVVAVAMRFLNYDFVLQSGDIGGEKVRGLSISDRHAGSGSQGEGGGGAGAD
jgi:hypothetical protein